MPLAAKIVFTAILGVSIVSSLFKNYYMTDDFTKRWDDINFLCWFALTALSWAWRITLIVLLWAF